MNLNETCFPIDPQDILPDGTPCIQGFCNKVRYMIVFNSIKAISAVQYYTHIFLGRMWENNSRRGGTILGHYRGYKHQ